LDFAVTPVILIRLKQQSETWSVGSLKTVRMVKGTHEPFAHATRSLAYITPQKWGAPTLVLITQFAAEIMLIAFLN